MAPRLREDLVTTTADEQGVACVEVTDPTTAVSFRFYDFEFALAKQLTGQPLEEVVAWASATYGVDLSPEALTEFIDKLRGLGFLAPDGASVGAASLRSPISPPVKDEETAALNALTDQLQPVLPNLHVLAGPLPPVTISEETPDAGTVLPGAARPPAPEVFSPQALESILTAVPSPPRPRPPIGPAAAAGGPGMDGGGGETPLGSIAHVLAGQSSGVAPSGALDVGPGSAPVPAAPAVPVPARATSGSGAIPGERRQPPRPEVVVMPPVAEPSQGIVAPRGRSRVLVLFLVLVGIGLAAVAVVMLRAPAPASMTMASSSGSPAPSVGPVHVTAPQPTTFYRWFEVVGAVTPGRDEMLAFSMAGRLQSALPPGTTFSGGETIARLQGVAARELVANKARSRVAYFEQLRDSSRAEGAEGAARQAEAKLAARKQELAAAEAALAQMEIRPKVAGEIAEILVPRFAVLKAGMPVFRVRATGPRATFGLSREDAARARALGFCRVETIAGTGGGVDGGAAETSSRAIDCTYAPPSGGAGAAAAGAEARLVVELVGGGAVHPGTGVRLASARYDGVFPVPRTALAPAGDKSGGERGHLWVLSAESKTAQSREVEVATTVDDLALISKGISVGDTVVVDPPPGLKDGVELGVAR